MSKYSSIYFLYIHKVSIYIRLSIFLSLNWIFSWVSNPPSVRKIAPYILILIRGTCQWTHFSAIFYVILQSLSNSSNSWFGIMDMQHFGESTLIDMSAEWLGSNIRQSSEILVNDSKQRLAFGNPAHVTLDGYSDDYTYCKWGSILLCIAPTARLLDHIWEEEKSRNDNERNKSRWILRPCSVGLEDHG